MTGEVLFQSRSGFSPYFGGTSQATVNGSGEFQSRSGFSPYFGFDTVVVFGLVDVFQSRSGFSPYFGAAGGPPDCDGLVSIPVWVFSLLRRLRNTAGIRPGSSFNPGLGFLPTSACCGDGRGLASERFQSRSGFSPYFGNIDATKPVEYGGFNPGLGFLPTSASRTASETSSSGFNPGLGFLPTSAARVSPPRSSSNMFQSRSGFSPYFGLGRPYVALPI